MLVRAILAFQALSCFQSQKLLFLPSTPGIQDRNDSGLWYSLPNWLQRIWIVYHWAWIAFSAILEAIACMLSAPFAMQDSKGTLQSSQIDINTIPGQFHSLHAHTLHMNLYLYTVSLLPLRCLPSCLCRTWHMPPRSQRPCSLYPCWCWSSRCFAGRVKRDQTEAGLSQGGSAAKRTSKLSRLINSQSKWSSGSHSDTVPKPTVACNSHSSLSKWTICFWCLFCITRHNDCPVHKRGAKPVIIEPYSYRN